MLCAPGSRPQLHYSHSDKRTGSRLILFLRVDVFRFCKLLFCLLILLKSVFRLSSTRPCPLRYTICPRVLGLFFFHAVDFSKPLTIFCFSWMVWFKRPFNIFNMSSRFPMSPMILCNCESLHQRFRFLKTLKISFVVVSFCFKNFCTNSLSVNFFDIVPGLFFSTNIKYLVSFDNWCSELIRFMYLAVGPWPIEFIDLSINFNFSEVIIFEFEFVSQRVYTFRTWLCAWGYVFLR